MTDRERLDLRGPVQSVLTECATLNPETGGWDPIREGPTSAFDREGRQEGRVRHEGQMITTVDEHGLRTTVGPYPPSIPRQRELTYGLCMDANVKFDVLTRYDRSDRPIEVVYRNPEQRTLYRMLLEYDDQNRIVRERVLYGDAETGTWCSAEDASGPVLPSPEEIERLAAERRILNPDGVFTAIDYEYDEHGRVTQVFDRMPPCWDVRRAFAYDDHDNVVEECYDSTSRSAGVDDEGCVITSNETHDESWTRYEYRYDDHGNWIEKVTFRREAPDRDFHRSAISRRTITYFESPR